MTFSQRFALTIGIVLIILLALALFGYFTGAWDTEATAQESIPAQYEARIAELERAAMDEAFKKHMMRLFDVWVTDYDLPPRVSKGASNARGAYSRAMSAIDKRERK